MNRQEFHYFGS